MITLTNQDWFLDRRELIRWLICSVVILCAHAGLAAALVEWREQIAEGEAGSGVVMVELSPVAVPEARTDLPPGPEQVQADPTPPLKPEEKVEEKVEPLPEQKSEVALLPTPPTVAPTPQEDNPPAPATTAPQAPRARTSVPTWKSQIVAILEHNKRYPPEARSRGQQGVTQLAFSLDRQGHVLSSRIVTSSGSAALDQETLELVRRAQPFPPPPPELAGGEVSLTVPVRFNIR